MKKSLIISLVAVIIIFLAFTSKKFFSKKEVIYVKNPNVALVAPEKTPDSQMIFMDPIKNIEIIEEGSDNIAVWAKNGIRNKTLVLVDAQFNIQEQIPDELISEAKKLIETNDYELLSAYTGVSIKNKRLYNSNNYLYAAHRLGLIKDVVWIIPISESIDEKYFTFFKEKLSNNPTLNLNKEDIESFEYSNKKIKGSLFGIPMTIVTINDYDVLNEPVVFSMNISYLTSFIINNVKTPIEDISATFVLALKETAIETNYLTIVNSNVTYDVPLQFRFLSNIFKDFFTNLHYLQQPKQEWMIKQSADQKLSFTNYDEAIEDYNLILKTTPNDPSIYHQLAVTYLKKDDFDKASEYLEEAIKRDKMYVLGYIDLYYQLQMEDRQFRIMSLGYEKHGDNIDILSNMASQFYKKGMFDKASEAVLKMISLGMETYEVNFYLADCYSKNKDFEKAKEVFKKTFDLLTEDEKFYYASFYIEMAEACEKSNDNKMAIESYKNYLKYTKNAPDEKSIKLKIKNLSE